MIDNTYLEALQETFPPDIFQYSSNFESSNIACYAYNEKQHRLMVAFKRGKVYLYNVVPKSYFQEIEKAESKGKAINAKIIKGGFTYRTYKLVENQQ